MGVGWLSILEKQTKGQERNVDKHALDVSIMPRRGPAVQAQGVWAHVPHVPLNGVHDGSRHEAYPFARRPLVGPLPPFAGGLVLAVALGESLPLGH